jgi:hypothetical protein
MIRKFGFDPKVMERYSMTTDVAEKVAKKADSCLWKPMIFIIYERY